MIRWEKEDGGGIPAVIGVGGEGQGGEVARNSEC